MVSPVSVVTVQGPLSGLAGRFSDALTADGYTPLSAANQLRLMAHVSRWMESESLPAEQVAVDVLDRFLVARRAAGYTGWLSRRGLTPLVRLLRSEGFWVDEPALASSGVDVVLGAFAAFLNDERGLAEATIEGRLRIG